MTDLAGAATEHRSTDPVPRVLPPRFSRFVWNSLQTYLIVCLVLSSLYLAAAAALAAKFVVVAGILGLWIVLLDWAPMPGLLVRIGRTLVVSTKASEEMLADRVPVLLRICGAALTLWAMTAGHG